MWRRCRLYQYRRDLCANIKNLHPAEIIEPLKVKGAGVVLTHFHILYMATHSYTYVHTYGSGGNFGCWVLLFKLSLIARVCVCVRARARALEAKAVGY